MLRIGLISDTHGLLRPQATAFLQGCDHIVHGGDIGHAGILDELAAIALHDLALLDIDPQAAGVHVVVSGHSHRPAIVQRQGVLFVNPGSAGPRRFRLPVSVAELLVDDDGVVSAHTVELQVQNAG